MDTLLANGDHATNTQGLLIPIEGKAELIQQALIRLSIPLGSLPHEPKLGSRLYEISWADTINDQRTALSYCREALAPLKEVQVTNVTITQKEPDAIMIGVTLMIDNKTEQVEVTQSR